MERYEAAMVLGALGNAMGYNNVCHECNKSGLKLFESDLSAKVDTMILKSFQWRASFDTLMHMATAEALVSGWDSMQELCNQAAKRYLIALHTYQKQYFQPVSERSQVRTKTYSSKVYTPLSRKEPKFGAAARTMCIGMCYSKAEQLNDLLQASVECGRMTHSYPAGFLGAFCTALFTSFAIQRKPIAQWGWRMMELMPTAEQYCERKMKHFSDYRENWFSFETKWQFYLQQRGIEKDGSDKAIFPKTYNTEDQNKLFRRWRLESTGKDKGLETTLIAYDALLFAGSDWKKLCYSAMFHRGESAATGAIAGSLYGILFGFDNVPMSLYQNLEFRDQLEQLGRQLYHIATANRSLCLSTDHTQRNESIDVRQIARMFVNKRTSDEINNLINYIALLEKVKKTSTEKPACLTSMLATPQASTKAKASKTAGKPRPTKFQLLQSKFTKIGFQNKLEKLELPKSKTKRVSEQSNTTADSQSHGVNFPTVDKRDTDFTEMHNLTDLMAEQKCETTEFLKVDDSLGKPVTENDVTALCHTALQPHSTNPEFSMVENGCTNFTKMQETIYLVIQQKCEPTPNSVHHATPKQSCIENGITDPCSNSLQSTGKQPFLTHEPNDMYFETARETDVNMQIDSPNKNKEVILPEPSVQTGAEVLYPNTEIQADYQTKNQLTKSTIGDMDENSGQNIHFAESINQKLPSQEIMTNSSLSISEISPFDIINIQENNSQTIGYNESTRAPCRRDTNIIDIDFPHIVTNDGQHCLLQVTEGTLFMKNNTEENPPQAAKESIEQTTKSSTSSPELFSLTSKTQTQKNTLQKSTFTTEILTYPNDKQHEIKQNDEQYKGMLSQPNELAIEVKDPNAMPKEYSPQTFTKKVEKTISQSKNVNPLINLRKNQPVKETMENSDPAPSKILIFPHNELLEMKNDPQKKYSGEFDSTAMHHRDVLQEQLLQIQNINTEQTANSQIRSLQPFTDSCEKQKLKGIQQNSESPSSTKFHILPETESEEKKQEDNQYRYILCQPSDSVNTTVLLTVEHQHQPPEALLEIAKATTLQTRNPDSLTDLQKKQKLKEIPQKLQPVGLFKTEGDYQHTDICNQIKESVHITKHYGDVEESFPAVDPNNKSAASAWNKGTSPTAIGERKSWKYKAYSYAEPSVILKSNRRLLMRATDVIQFSSPPPPSFNFL